MFALPISVPRLKSIIFCQNIPQIKLFLQKKMQNFRALRFSHPDPRALGGLIPYIPKASGGCGLRPQNTEIAPPPPPPIANSWLRPCVN